MDVASVFHSLASVSSALLNKPEKASGGNDELSEASLQATKDLFDQALHTEKRAIDIINALLQAIHSLNRPQTRSMSQKSLSGRSNPQSPAIMRPTPLANLHIQGMNGQQIWNQLDLRADVLCKVLKSVMGGEANDIRLEEAYDEDIEAEGIEEDNDDLLGIGDSEVDFEGVVAEHEGSEEEDEEDEEEEAEPSISDEDFTDGPERLDMLRDPSPGPIDEFEPKETGSSRSKKQYVTRTTMHAKLDDCFFSLSEFNQETEASEAQATSKGRLTSSDSEEEGLKEDIDLFAPVEQVHDPFDEGDLEEQNSGHVFYNGFFRPPKPGPTFAEQATRIAKGRVKFHQEVRVKEIKASNRGRSAKDIKSLLLGRLSGDEDEDEDGWDDDLDDDGLPLESDSESSAGLSQSSVDKDDREAIERFKDDLFGEDDEDIPCDLSGHEKRVAAIAKQIAELETKNVSEKDWTLIGEATSKKRPHNSLLEEDLDFERVQRAVTAITIEKVASLEALIRKRVIENRFDDVERKRPLDEKAFLPSRTLELKDIKSQQSLSQIYEGEYLAEKNGGIINEKDNRAQKGYEAMEILWEQISGKLDALCNAHFVPKQPRPRIQTISNVASASLETALPTTKTTATMLAPEEVFIPAISDIRDRTEMTPTEKRAVRLKERKARKRATNRLDLAANQVATNRKKSKSTVTNESKKTALKSIVKSGRGVTVVGNKISALDGKKKDQLVNVTGGSLKL